MKTCNNFGLQIAVIVLNKSQICEKRRDHDKCKNVSKKCECECHISQRRDHATKEEWILYLLKRQKANIGMICAFVKTDQHTAKQLIVNLRKKGHHISLMGYGGFYEYRGFLK